MSNGHARDASYSPFPSRAAAAAAGNPDFVVVAGGLNDQFEPDDTAQRAHETYEIIRATAPHATLIVVGAFCPYAEAPPGLLRAAESIKAVAEAEADLYLDPVALNWLPRRHVASDDVHPERAGHRSIARGFVREVRASGL